MSKKTLIIKIDNCRECPCFVYIGESGCRHYVPAHYVCKHKVFHNSKEGEYKSKFISEDDKFDENIIPEWCPLNDNNEVEGYTDWGW